MFEKSKDIELSEKLEKLVGVEKAFRLLNIWNRTSNPISWKILSFKEKEDLRLKNFKELSLGQGYSKKAIALFLELQGY